MIGLPALAQPPEPRRQAPEGRHDDLVANLLHRFGRRPRVLLLEHVPRPIVELAALEPLDRAHDGGHVPRERDPVQRGERIHDPDDVVGPELGLHEADERLLHGKRVAQPDVVVVEEQHEHTHVVTRELQFLVDAVSKLARRRIAGARVPVDADQAELLDRLRPAVFEHLEIGFGEIGDRLPLAVADDDVHADEIDARPEGGLLRGVTLLRRLRRTGLRRTLRRTAVLRSAAGLRCGMRAVGPGL